MQDFMNKYTGTILPRDQIRILNAIGNGLVLYVCALTFIPLFHVPFEKTCPASCSGSILLHVHVYKLYHPDMMYSPYMPILPP